MVTKRLILERQLSGGELNTYTQGAKPQPRHTRPNWALVPESPTEPRQAPKCCHALNKIQEPPGLIVTADNEEWQLADIVNSHWHYGRLQYCCVWVDKKARDLEQYYTDGGEFENSADIMSDFHTRYPRKPGGQENLQSISSRKKEGTKVEPYCIRVRTGEQGKIQKLDGFLSTRCRYKT